jgi:subtilisin family serine protease
MSHQSHTATPRGTRRTIILIAMLAAALLAPSASAANRHKVLPTSMRPIESKVLLRGADKNGILHLVVTLRTPGLGAPRSAGGAAQPLALQGAQISERIGARAAITALGGTVNAEFRYLFNGLRIHIPASQLEALRANPHVADVQLVTRYKRMTVTGGAVSGRGGATPSNAGAATEVQAKNVWAQTATSKAGTGYGVKVAVIDTGIDYTHNDYVRSEGDTTFPTAKVVAGYDLVGDAYAPGDGGIHELPQPDSDPMDCTIAQGGGHGTHVAGTIAGYGIKNGHTYGSVAGEYYKSTTDVSTFTLAPGMAPLASLIAVRVFGCDGATELAADGIEKAVALGANVINLSLGSPYGIKGGAEQAAINAAEKAGVTVVIAAGNEGDQPFLVGSPSTEDGAISVAALDDRASYPGAIITNTINSWTLTTDGSIFGPPLVFLNTNLYDLATPVSGYLHKVAQVGDSSKFALGCPATGDDGATYTPDWDTSGENLTGKIAFIRRGVCTFKEKVAAMKAKGAVAVVILQKQEIIDGGDNSSYPPFQGPATPTADIPVLMVNGAAEFRVQGAISDYGDAGTVPTEVKITTTPTAVVSNPNYHTVADFSSSGPRWGDLALKPEIAAPGVDIVSAASGSGDGVAWFSGTSMATPVVAGVAALVKQANPKWTPALIKSALINTAKSVGSNVLLRSVGAGRVNALNAVKAKVTIDAGPNATMSFGMVYGDAAATLTKSQTFIVKNNGTTTASYKFAAAAAAGFTIPSGVTVKIYNGSAQVKSTTAIILGAGKSKTFTVKLVATAAAQRNFSTSGESSLNAIITATSSGKPSLRLPVIAMFQHVEKFTFGAEGNASPYALNYQVTTGGQDAYQTDGTTVIRSVYPFVWLARDGRERIGNGADIKDIGVNAKDIPLAWQPGDGKFEMLITSWDLMSNPALNEWDIELDTDNNGVADQTIILADRGLVNTGYADGTLGCFYVDNLNWKEQVAGQLYDFVDYGECSTYVNPVTSVVWFDINQRWLWGETVGVGSTGGPKFTVTSYNGAGWDSDSSGSDWLYVDLDQVATGTGQFVSDLPIGTGVYSGHYPNYLPSFSAASGAGTGVGGDGTTLSLGWLFWNEFNAGPSSEVYEILIPPAE